MLTEITVQGFKSLRNVRDLALGRVNVFIGANGSGKSNFLEAIGLLGAAMSGYTDDQALLRRGVRPPTAALFTSSFESGDGARAVTSRATWSQDDKTIELETRFPNNPESDRQDEPFTATFRFNGQEIEWPLPTSFEHHVPEGAEVAKSFQRVLADYAIFAPNTPVLRGTSPDITQREPVGLAGGQLAEAVDELLDKKQNKFGNLDLDELLQLLDWVDEIAVVPLSRKIVSPTVPTTPNIIRFTDRWMAAQRNQLSAHDASEGALYVLFALVLALHPQSPRLLAIENLDQAMHPRLARATIRLFCEQLLQVTPSRQALLTTHNPLVLDGLDLSDDRIRLFTVERNRQGATRIDRVLVSDEILRATQEGLSLSDLWVMGRLGGVPDIF
jgi:predicted ATPase